MAWSTTNPKRSYSCNPDVLIYLRESKGWTQRELANASGYTERLISKAESGRTISADTIEILAETLSLPESPIYPEDLITDPVTLAKEYTRALYTHQKDIIPAIRHFLDEDVVLKIAGDPQVFPFAGEHRGIAELEQAFAKFYSVLEVPEGHDPEPWYQYIAQGNEVITWGKSWIHAKGHPLTEPIEVTMRQVYRRGKLILCEDRFDTQGGERHLSEAGKP